MKISGAEQERYWAKVDRQGPKDCWPWRAATVPAGYGKIKLCSGFMYAHRLALILDGRPRPEGAVALHSCNNPGCVNPAHLKWGTQKENMRQALDSGRAPHHGRVPGEKNGNAKLTVEKVRAIRTDPRTHAAVAEHYGVSPGLIGFIRRRVAWRHVA